VPMLAKRGNANHTDNGRAMAKIHFRAYGFSSGRAHKHDFPLFPSGRESGRGNQGLEFHPVCRYRPGPISSILRGSCCRRFAIPLVGRGGTCFEFTYPTYSATQDLRRGGRNGLDDNGNGRRESQSFDGGQSFRVAQDFKGDMKKAETKIFGFSFIAFAIAMLLGILFSGHAFGASSPINVTSVAALKALPPGSFPEVVLGGYYANGDGGGGPVYWSGSSTAAPDSCTVYKPSSAPTRGRWLRPTSQRISAAGCGTKGDGATDDGLRINAGILACSAQGGGTLFFLTGKRYLVDASANRIRMKSNTGMDLNGATIKRSGSNYSNNLIENFTYAPGTAYDTNITIVNGTIIGNGASDTTKQSHASPAGNIFFFGVTKFVLQNLKLDSAVGDCFGWRLASNGIVDQVVGGTFGRNLFSPTSGIGNRITNSNFDFTGFTGATPGAYIDIENDAATELSDTYWSNDIAKGVTLVDFWTAANGNFAHKARFDNCVFTGDSPRTFGITATNALTAKSFIIGETCRIAVATNSAAAIKISNVAGIRCFAKLANDDTAGQGTSRAIWCAGPVDDFVFSGSNAVDGFSLGIDASTAPLTHSRFIGAHIGDVTLKAGSNSNRFIGCKIGTLNIFRSDSNSFHACNITGTTTISHSSLNDFGDGEMVNIIVDSSASINNRFRIENKITGTKTFNNSSTWLAQIFEKEEGSATPTITGSTSGSATISSSWERYNILGDMCYFSMSATWTASTGVGYQKVNLNLPNNIVPVDGSTPSRWPVSITGYNFAFTGSQLAGDITGGNGFIVIYGLANTGTATSVPASTASGTYEGISGAFRVR